MPDFGPTQLKNRETHLGSRAGDRSGLRSRRDTLLERGHRRGGWPDARAVPDEGRPHRSNPKYTEDDHASPLDLGCDAGRCDKSSDPRISELTCHSVVGEGYRNRERHPMRKAHLALTAAAVLGLGTMAASTAPAEAGWRGGYGHGGYGYGGYRGGYGGYGYRNVGYRGGYGYRGYGHRRGIGAGAAIGLGIAGLAAGAIASNAYRGYGYSYGRPVGYYGGYGYGRPVGYYGGYGYGSGYGYGW